jgi:hypothetical protein
MLEPLPDGQAAPFKTFTVKQRFTETETVPADLPDTVTVHLQSPIVGTKAKSQVEIQQSAVSWEQLGRMQM